MHLLKLNNVSIFEQLQLEEALLRASSENWCLINTGSTPAIVMGISGKPEKLLNIERVKNDNIPVIKRFSGGGTVYIDAQTVFVTFICNQETFAVAPQPKPILKWTEQFYQPLFPNFCLKENDYVFGDKKFGGNAQYIQKSRWLHHTSFLWDYHPKSMDYLLLPEKRPKYRQNRTHTDFLCALCTLFPEKEELLAKLTTHLERIIPVKHASFSYAQNFLKKPHRKAVQIIQI